MTGQLRRNWKRGLRMQTNHNHIAATAYILQNTAQSLLNTTTASPPNDESDNDDNDDNDAEPMYGIQCM